MEFQDFIKAAIRPLRLIPKEDMDNAICKNHDDCRKCPHCKLDFHSYIEPRPVCTLENLLKQK